MQSISRKLYRLTDFRALGQGRIQVRYVNGQWVENDLRDLIAIGGIFTWLADDSFLSQARLGEDGVWLEWPGDIDIGADTLWEDGYPVAGAAPDADSAEPVSTLK